MNSSELKATISRQINQSTGALGDEISESRANAFERYMGEPYGDEVEGRSAVVSTDVADTIEWIMPELMEIFTGGDRICTFDPVGPEDEAAAEQETDTVNHVLMHKNDGFIVLYSFIKDGLLQKNGYAKRYWSVRERVTIEEYDGLDIFQWTKMQADWQAKGWEVKVLKEELEYEGAPDDGEGDSPDMPTGNAMFPPPEPTICVEVELRREEERLVVEPVPPEEMLVFPRWNKVSLDDCPFVAHRRAMTVSDLIEMGYDRKQVESLPDADDDQLAEEAIDRFSVRGSSEYADGEEVDTSTREVLVYECYLRVDWNGDGKAELRKVTVGGAGYEILKWAEGGEDNDEVEVMPFSAWTPVPVPHRHYGRSIAELVTDLQRIKTVLFRQMLDNVYLNNNPTREIAADAIGEHTLADLLHDRPGKILRTALPGHYMEHSPPQFMAQMLPAIEYVDSVRENRTGVTRYNQGLDGNSLNKTATGIQKVMSASMKKLALYARICAETGLKHLMMGIHGDLRRNASKSMTIRLRNEYVDVDPRSWAERSDMTVTLGSGTIDKELRMAFIERIIAEQKENILAGSPLASPSQLYNSYERYIENSGLRNVEEFFINPAKAEPQQQPQQGGQQGDPQAQAFLQAEQMKTQQRAQESQQDAALKMMMARMEDDRKRDEANMKMMTALIEMAAKAGLQTDIESIKAQAQVAAAQFNQPPSGGAQ